MAPEIQTRANDIRAPRMFELADRLLPSSFPNTAHERALYEDWEGAAHEAACALREQAGIPQFGKRNESVWNRTIDNWMIGS